MKKLSTPISTPDPELLKRLGREGTNSNEKNKNVKTLADQVLFEALESAEKTPGGIYITDNAKEKPQKGKVIAAGPGKAADNGTIVKMEVKVGDVILYGKYSGTEVTVDNKEYLIMRESDILAVI
jgi:chaperonin GroES